MWQSGQSSTTASSLPSCEVLGDLLNLSETQFSGTRRTFLWGNLCKCYIIRVVVSVVLVLRLCS